MIRPSSSEKAAEASSNHIAGQSQLSPDAESRLRFLTESAASTLTTITSNSERNLVT